MKRDFLRSMGNRLGGLARFRGRRPADAPAREVQTQGGRIYFVWLLVLPLLLGLTLGWFADVCLGVLLNRFSGTAQGGRAALSLAEEKEAVGGDGLEEFLQANPFRVSPMTVSLPGATKSEDVVVTGSLATAVLRGTLPGVGAWIEDKGKVRLVLVGTSFDVYTLTNVTYREAVFVKEDDMVVRELLYGAPGTKGGPSVPAAAAQPAEVPTGSVVAAKPGEQDGQVPAELVSQLVQNPFDELKKVRLRPMDDENGLQIQWIQDDSILKQLGVQKGDVIKSINGIPFNNMADIANSINSLMNSERFDVEVNREGKPAALRYVVH